MKEQILSDKQRRAKRIYGTVGIALTVLCFILTYFRTQRDRPAVFIVFIDGNALQADAASQ